MIKQLLNLKLILLLGLFIIIPVFFIQAHEHECTHCSAKCGTSLMFTESGKEQLQRTIEWDNSHLPHVGQKETVSPANIFKIHYDTVGIHAPPMMDLNQNGIADYVDSVCHYFDYVYDIYVNEFGFRNPYPDRGARGSDHYDVYLYDLGNSDSDSNENPYHSGGTYGATFFNDGDFISGEPFIRMYSFIVIDNDFASTDSIRPKGGAASPAYRYPGISSLKVTAAHEFFHAIQFMYGISAPASITVMEMNAVAMERVFFPEVKDYLQYVRALFRNASSYPFGTDDPFIGYGHSIFNQFLLERFNMDLMVAIWDNVALGYEVYSAMDRALKLYGYTLPAAWCEFLDWAHFTGNRAIPGSYFSNADELPLLEPFSLLTYSPPALSSSGHLSAYEMRYIKMIFPGMGDITDDTLNILLGNVDTYAASEQYRIGRNYFLQTSGSQGEGSVKVPDIDYWLYSENDSLICTNLYPQAGAKAIDISFAYPNPIKLKFDVDMFFPAPPNADLYKRVTLVIYDADMNHIFSKIIPVTVHSNQKVVHWDDIPGNLPTGTYIYGIKNDEEHTIGKFAIMND
ncbi:MAG: MXAN_6640 family putative metalloprotease [Candidatus Kapaibacterium sp.]